MQTILKTSSRLHRTVAALLLLQLLTFLGSCSDDPPSRSTTGEIALQDPASGYPSRVYWGDTHVHTSNSPDAFGFGVRLDAEAAYRFARGEQVTSTLGVKARLARPLDFLAVADHSDGLGFTKRIYDGPRWLLPNAQFKRWHDMMREGPEGSQRATAELIDLGGSGEAELIAGSKSLKKQARATRSIWKKHLKITERYNDPGVFTSFAAFEYTSMPNGNNLHRVVIFKDNIEKTKQVIPYSITLGNDVERLWDYMDGYEEKTGGEVLAIPHNSNVSNGLMFELTEGGGKPMGEAYARRRAEKEPLVEITQVKGDSEAHPFLSPDDEFAGYGTAGWDLGNLDMSQK
ncbi:MAG: DUF3604 domain-containing protein, partial [Pseudomonadales bacterium]|nr:DUF3604 domain-containing protein [Pseudomonadales bacterium]